jgi:hypothetical protein
MSIKNVLQMSVVEKDVENIYRQSFLNLIEDSQIISPCGSDGVLKGNNVYTLLEAKYNKDLKNKLEQSNIIIQCLYYLKKFLDEGVDLPTSCFIGDMNECFVIETKHLTKYLKRTDIDWNKAPSQAHKSNTTLLTDIIEDNNIDPFIYIIDDNFKVEDVVTKLQDIHTGNINKIKITDKNMSVVFEYFVTHVLGKNKLTTNEQVNLFIQLLIKPEENYLHPKKKNVLVSNAFGEIKVNEFEAFFKHYEDIEYTPEDKEILTGFSDRLIEDETRRRKGEFYTPTVWVNEAHKCIESVFGIDWKENYVVWDPASGPCILTRDYNFKELYCSTLEESDIETANVSKYNLNATKFQFDFLNDSLNAIPRKLQEILVDKNKEIIILMNPPYAWGSNFGTENLKSKSGVAKNLINEKMKKFELNQASKNLYSQFLFRLWDINRLGKIHIACFTPSLYKSGESFNEFRKLFLNRFEFIDSFLICADQFANTASSWGIDFSIWKSGETKNKNVFKSTVKTINSIGIVNESVKNIYNTDGLLTANKWSRNGLKGIKQIESPKMSSALIIKTDGYGRSVEGHIGHFLNNGNNVYFNGTNVSLLSDSFSGKSSYPIIPENFYKVTTLFTARKSIKGNWINDKDEYIAPNESHPEWQQFINDSIVYSLFNNSSQQSSLRQITYKDKLWDIKNEFFWLSNEEMKKLANDNGFDEMYSDAKSHNQDRFVYNKLKEIELSEDAKNVLDFATNLLINSIKMRKILHSSKPEYHLNSWDSGYAQLKLVWKEYYPDEFKEFRDMYKKFEQRLIPLVYELGFLRK